MARNYFVDWVGYAHYLTLVKDISNQFNAKEIYGISSGARSRLLKQIKSDILGIPYRCLDREEFGTLGSAILAGYGVGVYNDLKKVSKECFRPTEDIISPDDRNTKLYTDLGVQYLHLARQTESIFNDMAET